jgi:hypothetical protein
MEKGMKEEHVRVCSHAVAPDVHRFVHARKKGVVIHTFVLFVRDALLPVLFDGNFGFGNSELRGIKERLAKFELQIHILIVREVISQNCCDGGSSYSLVLSAILESPPKNLNALSNACVVLDLIPSSQIMLQVEGLLPVGAIALCMPSIMLVVKELFGVLPCFNVLQPLDGVRFLLCHYYIVERLRRTFSKRVTFACRLKTCT